MNDRNMPENSTPPAKAEIDPIKGDGHIVRICKGFAGCPRRAVDPGDMAADLARALDGLEPGRVLTKVLGHPPRGHHNISVSVSCCPNGCSRPQVADAGLIGASRPVLDPKLCTACGACTETCRESAIILEGRGIIADIDRMSCLACGDCARACPSGAIVPGAKTWRIQLGGRLGRHPRLAIELPGLYSAKSAVKAVTLAAAFLLRSDTPHRRMAHLVETMGIKELARRAKIPAPDAGRLESP